MQQAPLGLEQADVRGGVARGLDDLPGAEVGLDLHARRQVAVGLDVARHAVAAAWAASR